MSSPVLLCVNCRAELPEGAQACPACGQAVLPPLLAAESPVQNKRHWIVPVALLVPGALCAATAKVEGLPIMLALAGSVVASVVGAYWGAGWKSRMGAWWIVPCLLIGAVFGVVSLTLCFFGCSAGGFNLNIH